MTDLPRHDLGELPVTPVAQTWCDGRYVQKPAGLADQPVPVKYGVAGALLLLSAIGALGGIAYAQAKAEAKDAKAAVEKAEARLVKAIDDKKADDARIAAELAKKVEKQEAEQETIAAEVNAVHHLVEMLVLSSDGRLQKWTPRAKDFKRATPP